MKKILACVLALGFCTTTVEAGLISGIKNKVKNTASKVKNSISKSSSENKEIKTWLKNLKTLISNVIPDVQEISASATSKRNNTTDSKEISNADELKSNADALEAVLEDCQKNPFKIMSNTKIIGDYIAKIREQGGNVSKFSTADDNSTNYGKLMKAIEEYENKYNNNLESMKTAVTEIKTGWQNDVPTKNAAEELESTLDEYKKLTKVINDTELTKINDLVSKLSNKPGQEHKDIKILTEGITYLKKHAEYKKQSEEMAQPFLNRLSNKLNNAAKQAVGATERFGKNVSKIQNTKDNVEETLKSNTTN
ncbi:MAG: hypothetical protein J6S86_03680 [Alphaproteobacteria bacterium]|nr:hypothetical protein [Alphaproteobacteria bacterium]